MSDAGALSILNISESHSQPFSSSLSISFHFFPFLYHAMFFVQDTPITGVLAGMADLSVLSLPQWIPVAFSRRKPRRYSAVRLAKLNFILEGDCKGLGRLFGAEFADVYVD